MGFGFLIVLIGLMVAFEISKSPLIRKLHAVVHLQNADLDLRDIVLQTNFR